MKVSLKFCVSLLNVILLSAIHAHALTGSWRGELVIGQGKLPLVFNFSETADGTTECTLDSPAQGAKGILATVTFCNADSIALTSSVIGASYNGKIISGEIKGTFTQRGYSFPLNLSPETPVEERRPQTPKPPFPYSVTDTVFTAPDGAVMSGTLTIPYQLSGSKIPAVVMVTGSGPQNRDEEIFEHKPFAVIADYLARHGIASLRYDDRGTGKSGGNFLTATTDTFKSDAAGAVAFLRSLPVTGSVGVLGHSEGGTIAFMLGAEGIPDFVISLAGMAESGKETLMRQNRHGMDKSGLDEQDKENSLKVVEMLLDAMARQSRNGEFSEIDVDSLIKTSGVQMNPELVSTLKASQKTRTRWLDAFVVLNPREYLVNVKSPLLAINGNKDTQVDADNLTVIKECVPQAQTMLMPGLNHLMQHAVTGEVDEYGAIRETISPDVLDAIVKFVKVVESR